MVHFGRSKSSATAAATCSRVVAPPPPPPPAPHRYSFKVLVPAGTVHGLAGLVTVLSDGVEVVLTMFAPTDRPDRYQIKYAIPTTAWLSRYNDRSRVVEEDVLVRLSVILLPLPAASPESPEPSVGAPHEKLVPAGAIPVGV